MNLKPNKQSKQQTQQQISIQHQKQEFYSGPIPKPEDLEKYESIQHGFANRLLVMAEKEQDERIALNNKIVDENAKINKANNTTQRRGQLFAFSSVLLIVALCAYCIHLGSATDARYIAIGTLATVAGVFITGKVFFNKPNQNK